METFEKHRNRLLILLTRAAPCSQLSELCILMDTSIIVLLVHKILICHFVYGWKFIWELIAFNIMRRGGHPLSDQNKSLNTRQKGFRKIPTPDDSPKKFVPESSQPGRPPGKFVLGNFHPGQFQMVWWRKFSGGNCPGGLSGHEAEMPISGHRHFILRAKFIS